jgi:hypothetical protein
MSSVIFAFKRAQQSGLISRHPGRTTPKTSIAFFSCQCIVGDGVQFVLSKLNRDNVDSKNTLFSRSDWKLKCVNLKDNGLLCVVYTAAFSCGSDY